MNNKWYRGALKVKPYFQKGAQHLDDADALKIKSIYPTWDELVVEGSVTAEAGYKFTHNGDLYACLQANPSFQSDWVPGVGTESLYTRIDETHAGTQSDPIPYVANMQIYNGLYYSQNGVLYRCTRDSGQPLYHDLANLVGHYVEVV